MTDTPQASAVDAQLAEDAATKAAVAAQDAIKNAAVVAAEAEAASAAKNEKLAAETKEALGNQGDALSWLKDHANATNSAFQSQQTELQALRQETGELKAGQSKMAEALAGLAALLTPKQPEEPAAKTPQETPPKEDADGQKAAPKRKVFRRM